ncbi:sn-glycerol-3-phosphate ABC transporter ATP-binding protein UgpC [Janthinobacterium sp. SUN118]|nr:sn-glycerol-3-phosphate ABC transporter ATP-binding protein UgpC [Janthinobacterium sp. SUN118]
MANIACRQLHKTYDEKTAVLQPFDLEIDDGEFIVLLGPSGCGKSTLLRMIAGLEDISGGELLIGGAVVNDLPPRARNVAMVFQNYALYPHMTVYDNIAFGLRRLKVPNDEIERRVREVAAILSLDSLLDRKPRAMSGGQQQRTAIARAMIKTPQVFLFDEPLSNLDAKLRAQLRADIKRLHRRLRTTTLYVTHDQLEAMTLADRVVLMKGGHIEQIGTPAELYNHPRTLFAAGFIGTPAMNFIDGVIEKENGQPVLVCAGYRWPLISPRFAALPSGGRVVFGLRPNHLRAATQLEQRQPQAGSHGLACAVDLVELLGAEALISFQCGALTLSALLPANAANSAAQVGQSLALAFDEEHMHLFDADSGLAVAAG